MEVHFSGRSTRNVTEDSVDVVCLIKKIGRIGIELSDHDYSHRFI